MLDSPRIDRLLVGLFRLRTRGLLRLRAAGGPPPPPPASGAVELYVHIPFCAALCPFCSFHRVLHCPASSARYFSALHAELRLYHAAGYRFTGVYVGGGTPTLEPAPLLATLDLVRALFPVRTVSVETNPRELRAPLLADLAAAGVTRLSVGVQSFDDSLLGAMERLGPYGSGAEIQAHLRIAAGRFPTLNIDLIFNQPRQTLASFTRDLALVRAAGADQVSCYPLMSAPGVRRRMGAAMGLPDATHLRAFYDAIVPRSAPASRRPPPGASPAAPAPATNTSRRPTTTSASAAAPSATSTARSTPRPSRSRTTRSACAPAPPASLPRASCLQSSAPATPCSSASSAAA